MFLPKGAPAAVVDGLQAEIARLVHEPQLSQVITSGGTEPFGNTAAEFTAKLKADIPRWTKVARDAQIKAD